MFRRVVGCWLLGLFLFGTMVACSGGTTTETPEQQDGGVVDSASPTETTATNPEPQPEKVPMPTQKVFGGERPVTLLLPKGYNPAEPLPLIIVLHGLGVNGEFQAIYLKLPELQQKEKFLLLAPDGTKYNGTLHFWNAGLETEVNDVAYVESLIDEVSKVYRVDSRRVFMVGHSNGGFMAHRMACDVTSKITGIVSFAGTMFDAKEWSCNPTRKMNVLHIHGTEDRVVKYNGGKTSGGGILKSPLQYMSAVEAVNWWSKFNQCKEIKPVSDKLDLESNIKGDETAIQRAIECPQGGAVELWSIQGAEHIPPLSDTFAQQIWDWLNQHTKQ